MMKRNAEDSSNTGSLAVSSLFDGTHWHSNVELRWQQGKIVSIKPAVGAVLAATLVPGFIDLQVNGGGGVLFNSAPTVATLRTMLKAHSRFGSTAILPTIITDSISVMQQAADAVAGAIASAEPGVIGLHFEGPHLAEPKKGVHPAMHIRELSPAELAIYSRNDIGIKLVTVAPENVSPAQIRQLVGLNVIVCLGHSNADAATVQAALDAGASGFTHLYNAMSPMTSREPGMVGVALADADSWCGVIFDGHHMHPLTAKVALAAKPAGKLLLVTDAMAPVGTTDTEFAFFSGKVRREGSKLTDEAGRLAGSVLDMASAVRYAIDGLAVSPAEALRMASHYPAQALGCAASRGSLFKGYQADMVLLDEHYEVRQNWIGGYCVYPV
ncbi:N-acetylglucosamine-6-phosphate deacetylase [Arsukibacterium sp. UBA3155]|uniref:N-acetylglucosamine-6-phosphate deacetylase n=1 Tax=Arsukibacterium sp. UBA3155 TaxID=1946058 RepID=UPI0025C14A95|nr:N-acetylglucosamine-6-phosphate deacetylase [Arsukibacterium sp. UBA3155]|tara:strand:- start:43487 stop:44638 length:1152 start_codon:yes stop_codon:yes gene_type:complete